ncbi:hypothetical protein niasHT_008127 [Heterodera trifolii]|uniref:Potassium channel domain-containing protein n=1 Tax=Heterodera trifolii TaxID=157864 RepID=A0ABD2M232_9BILA
MQNFDENAVVTPFTMEEDDDTDKAKDGTNGQNNATGGEANAKGPPGRTKALIRRVVAAGGDRRWAANALRSIGQRMAQQMTALRLRFRALCLRFDQSARRRHSQMRASKRTERHIRRLVPFLLVLSVFVYVLLGAAAFLFFEHSNHEQSVRNWFFNLITNRHKFARQLSSAIFNGTRNMLIIVDYDSSERIQRDLLQLLSQYELQLPLRMPNLNEWTLENSLAYAWGLLTTIGHGHRAPKTRGGQLFALFYCLLGVPFFVVTLLVVSHRLIELCRIGLHFVEQKLGRPLAHRHLLLTLLLLGLHSLWLLLFSALLFTNAIPESFWRSLYTAVLSSLTIQSADYNALGEQHKLLCLGGSTLSLLFSCVAILSLTSANRHKSGTGEAPTAGKRGANRRKLRRRSSGGGAASSGSTASNTTNGKTTAPKFQMTVVDENGDTKLAPNPSESKRTDKAIE